MHKILIILCIILLTGCSMTNNKDYENSMVSPNIMKDGMATPCVMINDKLYHTTGLVVDEKEFKIDGVIESTVSGSELPNKNNQSNFGTTGEQYSIVNDDIIYIKMDNGKWIKFIYEK